MPKVPTYDLPQVQPQGTGAPTVSLDSRGAFGATIAQGLEKVGDEVGNVVLQEKKKADATQTQAAVNQVLNAKDTAFYDQNSGLMLKQGKEAVSASVGVYQNLENAARDAQQKLLTNDEQRKAFQREIAPHLEQARTQIEQHAGQQIHVANEATFRATGDLAQKDIANDYSSDTLANTYIKTISEKARAIQPSPEDGDAKIADAKAKLTATRLEAAMNHGDYVTAQAVLDAHGAELGVQAHQYQAKLLELNNAIKSDVTASKILKDATVDGYPWKDETKALAAVEALPPGKLKDEVQQRVEHQLALSEKQKAKAAKDKLDEVIGIYRTSGNPYDAKIAPLKTWLLDPHNGGAELWDKYVKELQADARAGKATTAEERRDERERQRTILETFKALPVDEQAKFDPEKDTLGEAASDLTKAQITVLKKGALAHMQKDSGASRGEFDKTVSTEAARAGIATKGKLTQFKASMSDWYEQQLQNTNGKLPPRAEVMKEMARQLTVGDDGGLLSFGSHFRFEAKPDETFRPKAQEKQKSPLNRVEATRAKSVQAYRYTKDRSKRVPVYTDGTQGAPEAVNGK
jgi:hypothetical protein